MRSCLNTCRQEASILKGIAMPVEVSPPKYVAIINTIQSRIEAGTYPAGSLLPSEATLTREFTVARPTLVRALEYLRQQGWIESRQGRGRFVLGPPDAAPRPAVAHGLAYLDAPETDSTELLAVGPIAAPRRVSALLGVERDAPVVVRRRLQHAESGHPSELGTVFMLAEFAAGTDLGSPQRLRSGLLAHLQQRAAASLDHARQSLSARPATTEEGRLLGVGPRSCLLAVVVTLHSRAGRRLAVAEVLLPGARSSLDDTFSLR